MKKKPGDKEAPTPNIKFIGKDETLDKQGADGKPIVLSAEPLPKINDGERVISMPAAAEQLVEGGFYHADATTIVRLYPSLYKILVAKGGSSK